MSQRSRSWFADNPFLTLLLVAAGLWLGWKILVGVFLLLEQAAKTLFLTLDASYGQAGGVLGYALLGLLLGAAAGAAAAQRRFRLNVWIKLGAGMLALAAVAVAYVGSRWAEEYQEATNLREHTEAAADAQAAVVAAPQPATPVLSPPQPDTTTQATDELYVVDGTLQLLPDWRDSGNVGLTYRSSADTLRLYRRTSHWGLVAPLVLAGQLPAYSGWVRLSQLTSRVEASPPAEPEPAVQPASAGIGARVAEEDPADTTQAVTPAESSHPVGEQQLEGQVGELMVVYQLDWRSDGGLSGSYYYKQQPATRYRLTGTVTATGELRLLEFTRGRQSARCVLQRQAEGYVGTMYNTDGRQFPMSIQALD